MLLASETVPKALLKSPLVLERRELIKSGGSIVATHGVEKERIASDIVGARSVINECTCSQTSVALRRSNSRQRRREKEYSDNDGEKRGRVGPIAKHTNLLT